MSKAIQIRSIKSNNMLLRLALLLGLLTTVISVQGGTWGGAETIKADFPSNYNPRYYPIEAAIDVKGNTVVTWVGADLSSNNVVRSGIFVKSRKANGQWTATKLIQSLPILPPYNLFGDGLPLRIVASETGIFTITWSNSIKLSIAEGTVDNTSWKKTVMPITVVSTPAISINKSGDILLSWIDKSVAYNKIMYMRRTFGVWGQAQELATSNTSPKYHLLINLSNNGDTFISWDEKQSSNPNAYTLHVSRQAKNDIVWVDSTLKDLGLQNTINVVADSLGRVGVFYFDIQHNLKLIRQSASGKPWSQPKLILALPLCCIYANQIYTGTSAVGADISGNLTFMWSHFQYIEESYYPGSAIQGFKNTEYFSGNLGSNILQPIKSITSGFFNFVGDRLAVGENGTALSTGVGARVNTATGYLYQINASIRPNANSLWGASTRLPIDDSNVHNKSIKAVAIGSSGQAIIIYIEEWNDKAQHAKLSSNFYK